MRFRRIGFLFFGIALILGFLAVERSIVYLQGQVLPAQVTSRWQTQQRNDFGYMLRIEYQANDIKHVAEIKCNAATFPGDTIEILWVEGSGPRAYNLRDFWLGPWLPYSLMLGVWILFATSMVGKKENVVVRLLNKKKKLPFKLKR